MPKKEIQDYIFYKIVCLDDSCELIYVGSTANWKARNYKHKRDCTNEKSDKYNYKVYKTIRANGGWCNFNMIEIGTAKQITLRRSKQIEDEYRVQLKASMNDRRCYLSEEQKKEYARQYDKKYREANKDKIKERNQNYYQENIDKFKEYKQDNKDKIKEYNNKYREDNRDKLKENREAIKDKKKEYDKEYREANEEAIKANKSEKITCQCGCDVTRSNLATHKKSQKHLNLICIEDISVVTTTT